MALHCVCAAMDINLDVYHWRFQSLQVEKWKGEGRGAGVILQAQIHHKCPTCTQLQKSSW